MTVETPDLRDFQQRLYKIERQNRNLQRALIAALTVFGAVILMGQSVTPPRVVEAQKFVLKDNNGKVRGWMGVIGDGSELILGNVSAQPMISLEVSSDSGDFHFYGSRNSGMNLGINSGQPSVSIANSDGHGGAGIDFGENGPSLSLGDGRGFSTIVGATQIKNPNGQTQQTSAASIVLFDKDKKVIWKTP